SARLCDISWNRFARSNEIGCEAWAQSHTHGGVTGKVFCDLAHKRLASRVHDRSAKSELLPCVPNQSKRQRHSDNENYRLPRLTDRHLEGAIDEPVASYASKVRKHRQQQ